MPDFVIAMLFGFLGTVIFHISKGMQRHGIEIYQQLINILKKKENIAKSSSKSLIYITGIALNNTLPIWISCANKFAPSSYFTSMFGLGLIALMLYSGKILHEPITKLEYIGSLIIVIGTLFLGIEGIMRKNLDMSKIDISVVLIIVAISFTIMILLMFSAYKKGDPLIIGIIFGIFGGASACLDPIFKGIGQHVGGYPGFIPSTITGWTIYLSSFIFSTIAFFVTQFGFIKKANASVLVPAQNCTYVIFPLVIQGFALPGFNITYITILSLVCIIIGIICMHIGKSIYHSLLY